MSVENKRVQICGMQFLPISNARIINLPGALEMKVSGEFVRIPIASGEFKEKSESGAPVEQELKATVTDTGEDNVCKLRAIFAEEGIVLLDLTNGEKRVIGTEQFPVLLTMETSGSPAKISLSFKRDSPEPAKIFTSF